MPDVITFGEAMIRLSPPNFLRLEQTTSLDVQIGGGELNVAAGVARLGLKGAWVSRLPRNPLGRLLENRARQAGVDTSHILWAEGSRMGLYFVEFGAAPRGNLGPLRPCRLGHQPHSARRDELGRGVRGGALASCKRHYAGARRFGGSGYPRSPLKPPKKPASGSATILTTAASSGRRKRLRPARSR